MLCSWPVVGRERTRASGAVSLSRKRRRSKRTRTQRKAAGSESKCLGLFTRLLGPLADVAVARRVVDTVGVDYG